MKGPELKRKENQDLMDFANGWIDVDVRPPDKGSAKEFTHMVKVYRILEAAIRARENHRLGVPPPGSQELDPAFLNRLESRFRYKTFRFCSPGPVLKEDQIKTDHRLRLVVDLKYTPDGEGIIIDSQRSLEPIDEMRQIVRRGKKGLVFYDAQLFIFLSDPECVEALRKCPRCDRLFLSKHKQKIFCRRTCAKAIASSRYYERKVRKKSGANVRIDRRKRRPASAKNNLKIQESEKGGHHGSKGQRES